MHFFAQFFFQNVIIGSSLHGKNLARIILICFHDKGRQRQHIDAVSILQNIQISITDTVSDHSCDAGFLPRSSSHPHNIMISPLNIQRVILHQTIHDKMWSRTSVIDISQNMKMIHNQTLDQLCQCNDKILRTTNLNDGIHNGIIISLFVQHLRLLRNQFLDHICIIRRKCFPYLGSGILRCRSLTDFNQTIQSNLIPVLHILLIFLDQVHLFSWIVNQCCQRTFVIISQRMSKHIIDLLSHCTGTISQYMGKSLILPVKVRHKMLCSLRQIQNRLEINDLRRCLSDCRINLCKSL